MLCGPVGCGKSSIALGLARMFRKHPRVLAHTIWLSGAELSAEQPSSVLKRLKAVQEEALALQPCLIVIDEIDKLLPGEPASESSSGEFLKAHQLAELFGDILSDNRFRHPDAAVAWLAIAGSATGVHKAVRVGGPALFTTKLEVSMPNAKARQEILKKLLAKRRVRTHKLDFASLAASTEGYTGFDLQQLVSRAIHAAAVRCLHEWQDRAAAQASSPSFTPPVSPSLSSPAPSPSSSSAPAAAASQQQHQLEVFVTGADFAEAQAGFVPSALKDLPLASSSTSWEDIGGLEEARSTLKETLELPAKFGPLFSQVPLKLRSGILLYGPPGMRGRLLSLLPLMNLAALLGFCLEVV